MANPQPTNKFPKGNKLGKGGARPGSGPKPDVVKHTEASLFDAGRCKAAADYLDSVMQDTHAEPEHRMKAAEIVLKRGFGNYRQQVSAQIDGDVTIRVVYDDQ